MVKILIQFNGKELTIPINPESITFSKSASNEDIEIIGLGKATRKGDPGLTSLTIKSFFPSKNSYYYTGVKPKTCVDFINEIWKADNKNNNVAKIVTIGLPININMFFVIESFSPEIKAGEEDDIYYSLEIKEYKPYGVKTITAQKSGLAASRAASTNKTTTSNNQDTQATRKTYTVVSGDCLWNITKKFTGNGARWQELYSLNKAVIGNNPNLIYPGQILTLPVGW